MGFNSAFKGLIPQTTSYTIILIISQSRETIIVCDEDHTKHLTKYNVWHNAEF